MEDETIHELESLLECAFRTDIFHYVQNGIKLSCDGYACEKCIEKNKELKCKFCSKIHVFDENELKPDRLCQVNVILNRNKLQDEIRNKWKTLNGRYFKFTKISFF
jgi:hypothetical protein